MTIHTKWPRLLVTGPPVTEAHADEILIRTNDWHSLFSNDKRWQATVERIATEFGRPVDPEPGASVDWRAHHEAEQKWCRDLGILDLEYLNNSRVMSCWYGGPHGWCNWDGVIGCDTYNIGKWPSDEKVTAEWEQIAAAFPWLTLTAQCVDDEGEGQLAAEWVVQAGRVRYDPAPTAQVLPARELDASAFITSVVTARFGGERGVSEERLWQAFERVTR
jgi:hypothetical protein